MTDTLYRWVKASHELPPANVLVVIRESNGEVYSDQASSWDKDITSYEWLEPLPTPSPGGNHHEQVLQLLITGGFLNPGKLQEARDIIASVALSPGDDIPLWYTKKEMYMWLIQKNYSHEIATELSDEWAKNLQGAYRKGWEMAANKDRQPDEPYKDFPSIDQSLEEAANKSFEIESKGNYFENHIYYALASENITPEQRMNICRSLYRSGYVTGAIHERADESQLKRLYDWIMDENRKPATTFFTSGWLRNVAKEIEFRIAGKGGEEKRTQQNAHYADNGEIVVCSNVHNKSGIDIQWLRIWEQVEIWYGDIEKKETGERFLKRLQATYFLSRPSIDIADELRKIAKLSTYDPNHDNMLYNMKDINKLVKELLNQSK